jgi:hypothetical protein
MVLLILVENEGVEMSLGIVIKGPEGLVLAAESRVTIGAQLPEGQQVHVNFDNATKLLSFGRPNESVGAVTYGLAAIGLRTAHSFVPEFEASLPKERLTVQDFAKHLSNFFAGQWNTAMPQDYSGPNMTFVVGGFDEGAPYGSVFLFEIPKNPDPVEQQPGPGQFGITWGGQREFVDRLIQGFDHRLPDIVASALHLDAEQRQSLKQPLEALQMRIPLPAMPLQDCVDLAIFFIRTTITALKLTVGVRGCGGPIDVATITEREGLRFVQRKEIVGEIASVLGNDSRRHPWHS